MATTCMVKSAGYVHWDARQEILRTWRCCWTARVPPSQPLVTCVEAPCAHPATRSAGQMPLRWLRRGVHNKPRHAPELAAVVGRDRPTERQCCRGQYQVVWPD